MKQEDQKQRERLMKIVSEFDTRFGYISKLDSKPFSEPWLDRKIRNERTKPIRLD